MTFASISVVTPSFNQGRFIRQTIDSILRQGYPGLEYYVLDGGSTDDTVEILKSYGNRFRWISGPDKGQTAAINRGWQETSGEIITWVNSDDLLHPGALEKVAAFFRAHPEIDWIYGDCDYIDAQGGFLHSYPVRPYSFSSLLLAEVNYIPQPATFLRRRVFEKVGLLDESLAYIMDLDYWLRAGVQHTAAYIPENLACLRLHPSSKSLSGLARFPAEFVRVYQRLFEQPGLPPAVQALRKRGMALAYHRAADAAFWANCLPEARSYAWKSFWLQPGRPRRLWLYLLLGKTGHRWAAKRHQNPYLVDGSQG